jgi:DNA-binding transcriptional LysR family regulator
MPRTHQSAGNVSIRHLQAFLALYETRNFSRAAERLHVSQSAFSAIIQKLEESVGARLFQRDTRNVHLTAEAEFFVKIARQLVGEINLAFAEVADHVARRKGKVAIAALPSIAAGWLPPVIAEYRRRYPGVAIELYDVLSDYCLELVRQGKADIALTAPGLSMAEFDTETLCSDVFFFVCHRSHALAGKKRLRIKELANCEFIHLARTTSVRQQIDAVMGPDTIVNTGLEVEQLATAAGLVAAGIGVTLVPELALFQFRHPQLVAIPLDAPALVRPILIVKRKGHPLSIAADGLLQMLQAKVAREAPPGAKLVPVAS